MARLTTTIRIYPEDFKLLKAIFTHYLKDAPAPIQKDIIITTPAMLHLVIEEYWDKLTHQDTPGYKR